MAIILPANTISDSGFSVDNSLRFDGSSAKLVKTNSSATSTDDEKGTFSWWWKRGRTEETNYLLSQVNGQERFLWYMISAGTFSGNYRASNGANDRDLALTGAPNFRDCTAWMHCVLAYDTSLATQLDRIRFYVNNVEYVVTQSGNVPQNTKFSPNKSSYGGDMEVFAQGTSNYHSGYLAEFCFVDGQRLTPSSFGEADEDSPNIWKPKDISSLAFGNMGYYLNFKDSSNLGNDVSANTEDFTATNLAATDQCTDTPTNNFCTMNPLDNYYQGSTFSEGNTIIVTGSGSQAYNTSTIYVTSGKWYVEVKPTAGSATSMIGIAGELANGTDGNDVQLQYKTYGWCYKDDGNVFNNNTADSGTWASYTTNDIIGIALDLDNNKLYFSKNGTWQNSGDPTSGSTGTGAVSVTAPASTTIGAYAFAVNETWDDNTRTYSFNFGNPSFSISSGNADGNGYGNFEYAPPSGYYSICSKNLAEYG